MGLRDWRQSNKRDCPNCNRTIRRLFDDKFLTCHYCGWTASIRGFRWITHPTWMLYFVEHLLRRPASTAWSAMKVGIMILFVGSLLVYLLPIGAVTPTEMTASDIAPNWSINTSSSSDPAVQEGVNRTAVERHFIRFLNEERHSRGLQNISQRDILTQMGQNHSQNMALHGYIGHVEPDGDTIRDRYRDRGLLPECRLPIEGTDRFYPGAENAAKWHIDTAVRAEWAEGGTYFASNERELASALFQQWMHSPLHRKAMLVVSADEAGLGLYITDAGTVYASLELC